MLENRLSNAEKLQNFETRMHTLEKSMERKNHASVGRSIKYENDGKKQRTPLVIKSK